MTALEVVSPERSKARFAALVLRAGVRRFARPVAEHAVAVGRAANDLLHLLRLETKARVRVSMDPAYDSIDSLVEFTTGILSDPEAIFEDDLGSCISPRNRAVLAVEAMKAWIDSHPDTNHPWSYPVIAYREGFTITVAEPEPVYSITSLAPDPVRVTEVDQFAMPTLSTKIMGVS